MAIDVPSRRAVLARLATALGVVACGPMAKAQPAENAAYVGIETSGQTGLSRATFYAASGAPVGQVPLDFRAHGIAESAGLIVVFPRRPGNRFAVLDRATLEVRSVVTAPGNRHFYGHGAFTRDGGHLVVTENDMDTLGGCLGIYRVEGGLTRVGEIALPTAGPHEITRDADRDRFHIAVGGLETHPDYGRTPFNLRGFRSQIVTLDFDSGTLDALGHWSGSEGISLRHLALDGAGRLYIGGQVADPDRVSGGDPVLWMVEGGREVQIDVGPRLAGYVSSVAAHGQAALISSKESGMVLRFEAGQVVDSSTLVGAGAVGMGPGLWAMSGFADLSLNGTLIAAAPGHEFDNHGCALGSADRG